VPAGAGVHGGNELKARRELSALRCARNGDASGLQRFAQRFERGARELGQLVQEQHPVVRQ
jgi:hypothetical protein